jgi:hypothetical protein
VTGSEDLAFESVAQIVHFYNTNGLFKTSIRVVEDEKKKGEINKEEAHHKAINYNSNGSLLVR